MGRNKTVSFTLLLSPERNEKHDFTHYLLSTALVPPPFLFLALQLLQVGFSLYFNAQQFGLICLNPYPRDYVAVSLDRFRDIFYNQRAPGHDRMPRVRAAHRG